MARVNVYIPDELKARMDRAGNLNWSATAQRAFEVEVHLKEVMMTTEDSVVARLRASKMRQDEVEMAAGRKAGQRWAREWAEYGELERVATYDDHMGEDPAVLLACLIFDVPSPGDLYQSDVQELWDRLRGRRDEPPSAWIEGFVEGATEVWGEVAEKI
jgi:hypothetical protein